MNIQRLRYNTPILIEFIQKNYKLTDKHIAMIFNKDVRTVKRWKQGRSKPDQDMINAMILAYRWVRIIKPFKFFFALIAINLHNTTKRSINNISRLIRKSDQIKLKL